MRIQLALTILVFAATPALARQAAPAPAELLANPLAATAHASVAIQHCPDRIVYGDPSHPNRITFLTGAKERVLYFERVAAVAHPGGGYTVHFPTFGRPGIPPVTLEFKASPSRGGSGYDIQLNYIGGIHQDCMRIMPQIRWSDLSSEMEVLAFQAPGERPGRLAAEIRKLSRGNEPSGLIAKFDTEHVRPQAPSTGEARGRLLRTGPDGAVDTVDVVGGSAVFNEGQTSLELQAVTEHGVSVWTVHGVTGAPQVTAVEYDGGISLHQIHALSPDRLVYDQYLKERVRESAPERERILRRIGSSRTYDVVGAQWLGRLEISSVVVIPHLPHLSIGDEAELRLEAATARLAPGNLQAAMVRDLASPTPGHAYVGYYPRMDLARPEYTETVTRGGNAPFVLRIQDGIRRPEGEAAPPEPEPDPAVAAVLGILKDFSEAMEELEPWDDAGESDDAAVLGIFTATLKRHNVKLEREVTPEDLNLLGNGGTPFFFAHYGEEVVQEAFRQMEALRRDGDDIAELYKALFAEVTAYDAVLHLDERGLPLRRTFRESNTDFEIEYRGEHAFITARNENQGIDTATVAIPPGTLDILQWNEALSRLPLREGFERTLTLFDLDVGVISSQGLGADGQGYSRRYVSAEPTYSIGTVRVTGREEVEVHGARVAAFRAEVSFGGRPAHPVMSNFGPEPTHRGREGSPLVYWLSVDAPHRVLAVDWGEMVVQRALR